MNIFELLDYEIRASGWAQYIGIGWMQELVSRYFGWKVKRKYKRYLFSKDTAKLLKK